MTRRAFLGVAGASAVAGARHNPPPRCISSRCRGCPASCHSRVGYRRAGLCLPAVGQAWHQGGGLRDNTVPGGRIRTLRGHFEGGQIVEEHAEFINPEHTATLALAKSFGLRLDNTDKSPPGTHPGRETMRFHGKKWPQAALNRDWHDWAWKLFHHAAFVTAPWPQTYRAQQPRVAAALDHMSVTEWVDTYIPGGVASDFGGPVHRGHNLTSTAARPMRHQRSTWCISLARTRAPPAAPSPTERRSWGAGTRSGTSTAGMTS